MIIATDAPAFAEELFVMGPHWQNADSAIHPAVIKELASTLFPAGNILTTVHNDAHSLWQYVFIANHAPRSQFSALIDFAKDHPDLPGGILCLARSGDKFKGYRKRSWITLAGNIHLSAYLKPNQPVDHFHTGFTILSALSVIQTVDKIPALKDKAAIKWINDIIINDAKTAGVLTHTQTMGHKVTDLFIGIGINVTKTPNLPEELIVKQATSLNAHLYSAEQVTPHFVLKYLLTFLTENYILLLNGRYIEILDAYRDRSAIIGKKIIVYSDPFEGTPEIINTGTVKAIGENLELFLEGKKEPVTRGRIVFDKLH